MATWASVTASRDVTALQASGLCFQRTWNRTGADWSGEPDHNDGVKLWLHTALTTTHHCHHVPLSHMTQTVQSHHRWYPHRHENASSGAVTSGSTPPSTTGACLPHAVEDLLLIQRHPCHQALFPSPSSHLVCLILLFQPAASFVAGEGATASKGWMALFVPCQHVIDFLLWWNSGAPFQIHHGTI